MEMGEIIRQLRIKKGLTQEELGALVGLQKSAIAKYENGRVENIKRSTISKLSEILDCSPSYLMGWEDNKPEELSAKAEKDIKKALGETLEQLENSQDALMFDGEPIDDETRELLKSSLENSMRLAKKIAKEKYTPKKYKK